MVMYQSSLTGIFQTLFIEINANPSHCSLPFLLQDWLHGFPGLFTDRTSEHIRFLFFSFFFFFSHFLAVGSM